MINILDKYNLPFDLIDYNFVGEVHMSSTYYNNLWKEAIN
jgi:hypothetical protein